MIVVDASVMINVITRQQEYDWLTDRFPQKGRNFSAPEVLDLEVAQVLRRLTRQEVLSQERARSALLDLMGMQVRRHSHHPLMERIWELRDNFTAYDAAYVALAESLDAELLTADIRLARSAERYVRLATTL